MIKENEKIVYTDLGEGLLFTKCDICKDRLVRLYDENISYLDLTSYDVFEEAGNTESSSIYLIFDKEVYRHVY